ncbi:zinc finger, CCHC-type containing protein [Tanacetum coccineum]
MNSVTRGDDGISEYGDKVENRDFGQDTNKHYYFSITAFDVDGSKGVASHGGGGKVGQELEFYSSHTGRAKGQQNHPFLDLSTLSDALHKRLVVARPKTAKEARTFISYLVKDNKRSRTSALKTELRSIKLGDLTMEAYFQKIESIMTILASLDSLVNDEDVVHYALEGLPEKYNQVCGYMHYKDMFLDLKTALSLLITKEMRLKSKALSLPMDSSYPMVLMANPGNNRTSSTTPQVKSWRPCFNFAKGTCRFGESCCYVHDANARLGTINNGSNRGRGNGDNTTNELLNKLIQQLGNITCTSTVPSFTNNASSAVAFNTGPSHPFGPYVGPNNGLAAPPGFSHPAQQACPRVGHYNAGQQPLINSACHSNVFNTCLYSSVLVGDGHPIPVTNSGHSILPTPNGSLHLRNVLITPSIVKNLIYVRQFVRDNNCTIKIDAFGFSVKDFTTRRVLLRCDSTGDLYPVTSPSPVPQAYLVSQHTWHQRLGHPGSEVLRRLISSSCISCNKEKPPILCHACQLGKHVRLPFVYSETVIGFGYYNNGMFMLNLNKVPDDSSSVYMSSSTVVNSSLWHARLGHVNYKRMLAMSKDDLIPAIDENTEKLIASRFCYVYLLYAKDEALDKFKIYKTEVELQQNDLIKTLRTDRGGEYYNPVLFQSVGIFHETTTPYTPQQNGVAERKNRTLKEMVKSMLSYSGLSEGLWGEAILTSCYLLNRVPNKRNTTTPYDLWYKKRPNLSFLHIWGCRAHSKAYRFYVIEPNDSVSINTMIESRDAIFYENRFSSIPRPKYVIPNSDESQRDDHSNDVPIEGSRDQIESQYSYCYSIEEDPRTYNEAMQSRDAALWKEEIDDEIGSIMKINTWVLSDLPPGCKPLGCKWIFKRKMKVDGTIDKFKARLVIQGFRQKERIVYFDTYVPVARITTIRLLLALAAIHNLVVHQMDVKTAFLNGDLEEEVYMKQPEGFVMPGNEHKASKKLTCITGSTIEYEFIALAAAGKKAYAKKLIHEIQKTMSSAEAEYVAAAGCHAGNPICVDWWMDMAHDPKAPNDCLGIRQD